MGWAYLLAGGIELIFLFIPPGRLSFTDIPYLLLLAAHLAAGLAFLRRAIPREALESPRTRAPSFLTVRVPEMLLAGTLLLFLFSYIYALNANMDYVQRFMATGGAVRLALDTARQRLVSAARFLPPLLVDLFAYLYFRLRPLRGGKGRPVGLGPLWVGAGGAGQALLTVWALPAVGGSALLVVFSFPSFLHPGGLSWLAFVALVPLLLVLEANRWRSAVLYGTFFAVLQGMLANYWLGTFSLISLQLVSLYFLGAGLVFMSGAVWLAHRLRRLAFLVYPLAWVFFDYLRSGGFLGYPWGMLGASQYAFTALIQGAALTGVWGITFLVVLVNTAIARVAFLLAAGGIRGPREALRPALPAVSAAGALLLLALAGGGLALAAGERRDGSARTVRVALVQQNTDPRKHEYGQTFATLRRLTDRAMASAPDLVVWSETAFIPNIRRWSREDPALHPLAGLVRKFLDYQKGLGAWLLTGNDDYELIREGGVELRRDYNAAVLFDPLGERAGTYHKMHLVPFTESFPFRESLPGVYELLLKFDVTLWEPGRHPVIFHHPGFSFVTPICFEDAFPGDIRNLVRQGAQAIVNLSNDYWSLTEVEARQHFANSLFRAVENRRPLLRATASGVTAWVDPWGRVGGELPCYVEDVLVVDMPIGDRGTTFYNRHGDWFPAAAGLALAALALASLARAGRPGLALSSRRLQKPA